MKYGSLHFVLLLTMVGMSLLPPHVGLLRDNEPFDLQYLQTEQNIDCHCKTHKELIQSLQQQYQGSSRIAYIISCSSAAVDYTFSSLKLILIPPFQAVASNTVLLEERHLPTSLFRPSRSLTPPEPPPKLS